MDDKGAFTSEALARCREILDEIDDWLMARSILSAKRRGSVWNDGGPYVEVQDIEAAAHGLPLAPPPA